jgi:hypothetical protein
LLAITVTLILCCGIIPFAGTLHSRWRWAKFRRRFDELRLAPLLDYRLLREAGAEGGVFRLLGGVESVTEGRALWVKGENLTIPVSLENTESWIMLMRGEEGAARAPERVRWNRVSTLTEGAKVFVGGRLQSEGAGFVSAKDDPLMVIFYDCPDEALAETVIRSGRTRNEYLNGATPVSLFIGALAQVSIAASFLDRPAYRLTVISALIALCVPALPWFPPGLLFTLLYRRLSWHALSLRAGRDLIRLPLRYLPPGEESAVLSTGERYGYAEYDSFPSGAEGAESGMPVLPPESLHKGIEKGRNGRWRIYGVLAGMGEEGGKIPIKSKDPFVSYGLLPARALLLARRYTVSAYAFEALAWLAIIAGIILNIVFVFMILSLFRVVSFSGFGA